MGPVTPAGEQERALVGGLRAEGQSVRGGEVALASVHQGYTGEAPAAAAAQGITLAVVRLPEARRGFVLLPRRPGAPLAQLRLLAM